MRPATCSPLHTYGYTYDWSGNRLTETLDTVTRSFGYNAANQLTSEGATTLTYDLNGNLLNDGTNAYVWDRANRLLSVGGASYAYDGDGDRHSRTVGGTLTRYLLDKQTPLTLVLSETTGGSTTRYLHGPTGIFAQQDNTQAATWGTQFMLQDGLGSVRAISDDFNVLSAQAYSPYGEPLQTTLPSDLGFTGEQTDALNDLVYLRARYLNPKLGSFVNQDPLEGKTRSPNSLNRYAWVQGNVTNLRDASGLNPFLGAIIGLFARMVASWVSQSIYNSPSMMNAQTSSGELSQVATPQPLIPMAYEPGSPYDHCVSDYVSRATKPISSEEYCQGVPTTRDTTSIYFGGSNTNLGITEPVAPTYLEAVRFTFNQARIWADLSDRFYTYPGGKAAQARQALTSEPTFGDVIAIGFSAGADAVLIYADEFVPTAYSERLRSMILLGPTMAATIDGSRTLHGSDLQYSEVERILKESLSAGTNILVYDDAGGDDPTALYNRFQAPTEAGTGHYCYVNAPQRPHFDYNYSGLGTNDSTQLRDLILEWERNPNNETCNAIRNMP